MKIREQNRADQLLRTRFPSLSKRQVGEAFDSGFIFSCSGKRLKKGSLIPQAEELDCSRLESYLEELRSAGRGLDIRIVEESSEWLVVDKPPGLKTQPLSLFDTETVSHWALTHVPGVSGEFLSIQPEVCPHRLDIGTSGLLIVAKNRESFKQWRQRFKNGEVKKKYLAWCWGKCEQSDFTISFPIAHALKEKSRMVSLTDPRIQFRAPVQEAESRVIILKRLKDKMLVSVEMNTGVTHQIRVHLSSVGFPLIGDKLYDDKIADRKGREKYHLLRATELTWSAKHFSVPDNGFSQKF